MLSKSQQGKSEKRDKHNVNFWDIGKGKVCNNCRLWTPMIDAGYCDIDDQVRDLDDTCSKYNSNIGGN